MILQFDKHLNVLVIPTNQCNLRCAYCFHHDEGYSDKIMDLNTLEHFLKITVPYYSSIHIIWHGGEPTLAGIEFYKNAQKLIQSYLNQGTRITQAIQTNATLITEDYAAFFKQNKIGVGVSFDGINNDIMRGQTNNCLKGLTNLKNHEIIPGIICVVNKNNVSNIISEYEYFKRMGLHSVRFNYYLPIGNENVDAFNMIDENELIQSYISLFLHWCKDSHPIRVDPFLTIIDLMSNQSHRLCEHSSCLQSWLCMRPDGELTPCDRVFPKEYAYGNVWDYEDIRLIYQTSGFMNLISESIKRRNYCKKKCNLYDKCFGGCNSKALEAGDIRHPPEYVCNFFISLYSYIDNYRKNNPDIIKSVLSKVGCNEE